MNVRVNVLGFNQKLASGILVQTFPTLLIVNSVMVFTFWKRPTETLDTVGQNSLNVTLVFAKAFSLINVRLVGHSENVTGLPLKQFSCISVIPSGRTENLTPLSLNAEEIIPLR